MGWTDERVDALKQLWSDGLSCSQIARALGGVTRNAVIGKVHRLGLAERASSTGNRTVTPRVPRAPRPLRTDPPLPVEAEDPLVLEGGGHVTMHEVGDRTCRWPIGDPADINRDGGDFHFCGHKPKGGGPYCEAHARKAYQPHVAYQPRRRRVA